jgi:hypothetical protein
MRKESGITGLDIEYEVELHNGVLCCGHTKIDKSTYKCEEPVEIPLQEKDLPEILRLQDLTLDRTAHRIFYEARERYKERNKWFN